MGKNMGNIIGKYWITTSHLLGHFCGELMEEIWPKASYNYSASFWANNFSICLYEKPKPLIFMISGFLGPVGTLICGFEFEYAKLL